MSCSSMSRASLVPKKCDPKEPSLKEGACRNLDGRGRFRDRNISGASIAQAPEGLVELFIQRGVFDSDLDGLMRDGVPVEPSDR
jgi:hypothetical protein